MVRKTIAALIVVLNTCTDVERMPEYAKLH